MGADEVFKNFRDFHCVLIQFSCTRPKYCIIYECIQIDFLSHLIDCLRISHGNASKERENHVRMQANCDQIPTYLTIDKIPGKNPDSRHITS